jgi:hemolysin activation/secretion protein
MGRAELGLGLVSARPVVFYDLGWAGARADFAHPGRPLSGAGVGASFLDGLVRFDLSRGIYPEKRTRFDMYLEARF